MPAPHASFPVLNWTAPPIEKKVTQRSRIHPPPPQHHHNGTGNMLPTIQGKKKMFLKSFGKRLSYTTTGTPVWPRDSCLAALIQMETELSRSNGSGVCAREREREQMSIQ